MVRVRQLIPASLTLSIGIAPAIASSSSSPYPAIPTGHARSALAEDIARLHRSVKRARSIIEIRDANVPVSTSKLQEILGEIKGLESQVSALLPDEAEADGSQASGTNECDGSADQVGPGTPSRGNANCPMNAGAAARRPGHESALGSSPSPAAAAAAGTSSDGAKDSTLPGAVFDETSGFRTSTSSSLPSLAASKFDFAVSSGGRDGDGSPAIPVGGQAPAESSPSAGGKGEESDGISADKADEEMGPAPSSAAKEDVLMETPSGATAPRFLTARPAKAPQQAVITPKPAATGSAKDNAESAAPVTMSLGQELTTTTITRTGSSRTTIKITMTRTRTIRMDWRSKSAATEATQAPAKTTPAIPSPSPDEAGQDMDQGTEGLAEPAMPSPPPNEAARDTEGVAKPAMSSPFPNDAGRDTDAKPAMSSPLPDKAGRDTEGGAKPAMSSPFPDEASQDSGRVATRAPNFSQARPRVNAQQPAVGLQRYTNSTMKLYAPLKADTALFSSQTTTAEAPTPLARVLVAPPAMTTRMRLMQPRNARPSSRPPSGFKTITVRESKRPSPNETRK